MEVLDVGCGKDFKGTVNCDLYVRDVGDHRYLGVDHVLDLKVIPNFIVCSALFLPFKDGCFDKVVCRQVIEHVDCPQRLFGELVRVCTVGGVVNVESVHRFGEVARSLVNLKYRKWQRNHHVSKFNSAWFRRVADVYGLVFVRDYILQDVILPSKYFRLVFVPYEFGFEFKKC